MELLSYDIYQWFRVWVYGILALLTVYNARRFRGLMKLWFLFLALMFGGLSASVYLHVTNSSSYDEFTNSIFSPIVVALTVIALAFVINHHIKPPFNRRKDDV